MTRTRRQRKPKLMSGQERRLAVERHRGRPLGRDEVVHHINGDPSDNRFENLQVMTADEHKRLHRASKIVGPNSALKRRLRERGLTYPVIGKAAGVGWWMVYAVINRRRNSARVMATIEKLLGGVHVQR